MKKRCIAATALGLLAGLLALLPMACTTLPDEMRTVVVMDPEGRPMQGARVFVQRAGPVVRGMTGSEGHCQIRTPGGPVSLVVERRGYLPTQVPPTTNRIIKVMMQTTH